MKPGIYLWSAAFTLSVGTWTSASQIRCVPADYPTIQAAIDIAVNGDKIIVAPGTYDETINFLGKEITLQSSNGPEVTIICPNLEPNDPPASVVTCTSDEGRGTELQGFTIQGGQGTMFAGNTRGGGMFNLGASPIVTKCIFKWNSAFNGGGMGNFADGSTPSDPLVLDCIFEGNEATNKGGGMYNNYDCSPTVVNCLFVGNFATVASGEIPRAGGLFNHGGYAHVINCTFAYNTAIGGTGAAVSDVHGPGGVFLNCVLWNNEPSDEIEVIASTPTVSYSNVQNWSGGVGNIYVDPNFVRDPDPGTDGEWGEGEGEGEEVDDYGDLHLSAGSLCIDAGDNSALPADVWDLDGDGNTSEPFPYYDFDGYPRISGGVVDMGAYEVQTSPPLADAGGPYIALATMWDGAFVQLDGAGSYDPEGGPLTYSWDLDLASDSDGDGDPTNDADDQTGTPLWVFLIGQTEISLIVTDESGLTSEPSATTVTVSVIDVSVDIKPGSYPNSINMGSYGVVPVAFLTDSAFDASTIDPLTVQLRGEDPADGLVKLRGKKNVVPMAELEDVDGDGDLDLVVHLDAEKLADALDEFDTTCELGAMTYDGYVVSGVDSIRIVPP